MVLDVVGSTSACQDRKRVIRISDAVLPHINPLPRYWRMAGKSVVAPAGMDRPDLVYYLLYKEGGSFGAA